MGSVEIITILIPIYYLVVTILIILAIIYTAKVIRRYLKNGELAEKQFERESEELKEIKERLNKIETLLKDID